jgi:hypothetical protein
VIPPDISGVVTLQNPSVIVMQPDITEVAKLIDIYSTSVVDDAWLQKTKMGSCCNISISTLPTASASLFKCTDLQAS